MTIKIVESWLVAKGEIIVEIKYSGGGLPEGTQLISKQSGRQWTVRSRLFYSHTIEQQKKFPNETESLMHFSFKTNEHLKKSTSDILTKEDQGIYQYVLNAVEHTEKPAIGELLETIL